MALAGLSALGPSVAALVVGAKLGELRLIFGRWRTRPVWIMVGLVLPMALHLPATLIDVTCGGYAGPWLHLPCLPSQLAAMLMFSVGEEFGWRGFAYPRLVERHGPLLGNLVLGVGWALWHLVMLVSPETGQFNWVGLATFLVDMPLYCLVYAWCFERGGRSLAVAIALHAGAHLDNIYRDPNVELRLRVLRSLVLLIAATFAARWLQRRQHSAGPLPRCTDPKEIP